MGPSSFVSDANYRRAALSRTFGQDVVNSGLNVMGGQSKQGKIEEGLRSNRGWKGAPYVPFVRPPSLFRPPRQHPLALPHCRDKLYERDSEF
jgi:hypothetical protein